MLWCASCTVEYPDGKKFCRSCGNPLEEKPAPVEPSAKSCTACHRAISPTAKFCPHCGASVFGSTEKTTENEMTPPFVPEKPEERPDTIPTVTAPFVEAAEPATRFRRPLVLGVTAALVFLVAGLGLYFRESLPFLGPPGSAEVAVGSGKAVQADTPLFKEPTRNSKIVLLLGAGEAVELLQVPEQKGIDGILWARVRTLAKKSGFVDVQRLVDLVGKTDRAQYQIVRLQLHENPGPAELVQDVSLLEDFLQRFPSSSFASEAKLALGNRYLILARNASGESNDRLAFERSQAAVMPIPGSRTQPSARGQNGGGRKPNG